MPSRQWAAAALVLSSFMGDADRALGESPAYDPARMQWSELDYLAARLAVTATSEVRIRIESASQAAIHWLQPSPGQSVMPAGDKTIRVRLGSQIMGKKSDLDLWLDPVSGAAFQRTQLETGKKVRHHRHRSLRFGELGVFNSTYRATDETVDRPHKEWKLSETFEPFPEELGSKAVVTEPSALLYLLAVADLERQGDRTTAYVFSKDQVMQVHLIAQEKVEIKVDYIEESSAGRRVVKGRHETMRIRLDGRPMGTGGNDKDFEFLGLRGDVDVYLDSARRIPLQISGNIKFVGKGHVRLQRVRLK